MCPHSEHAPSLITKLLNVQTCASKSGRRAFVDAGDEERPPRQIAFTLGKTHRPLSVVGERPPSTICGGRRGRPWWMQGGRTPANTCFYHGRPGRRKVDAPRRTHASATNGLWRGNRADGRAVRGGRIPRPSQRLPSDRACGRTSGASATDTAPVSAVVAPCQTEAELAWTEVPTAAAAGGGGASMADAREV